MYMTNNYLDGLHLLREKQTGELFKSTEIKMSIYYRVSKKPAHGQYRPALSI